jgi:hypothetical protein
MVPKITPAGRSFKGAHLYYGHDKKAVSQERVLFFETLNLRTQDPDKAWKQMAWTAEHEEELKFSAGVKWSGAKTEKPVYAFSLAWDIGEAPSPQEMREAALSALASRRLQEHQAVLYGHNDTEHKHVHVLVNLIHPETGRCANTYRDRYELSRWAQSYEEQQGKIRCHQRVENNRRRDELNRDRQVVPENAKGNIVRGRDRIIQEAWSQSDSGKSFSAALEERGYLLAMGDPRPKDGRRIVVVIDPQGRPINPTRHIDGENGKNIRKQQLDRRLADLEMEGLPDVKAAKDRQLERQYIDRDKQRAEQEQKNIDAAIEAEKKRMAEEKSQRQQQGQQDKSKAPSPSSSQAAAGPDQAPDKLKEKSREPVRERSFAETLDRLQAFETGQQRQRDALEFKMNQFYDPARGERLLADARKRVSRTDNFIGRLTGKHQKALDDAAAYQKNLDNLRQRIKEEQQALENRLKAERLASGMEKQPASPAPSPRYESARDMLDRFERSAAPSNDNAKDKDKQSDKGQDRQRDKGRDPGGYER